MKSEGDEQLAAHPALAVLNHAAAKKIYLWKIKVLKLKNKLQIVA